LLKLEAHHGFLQTPSEAAQVLESVAAFNPHLVLVGMGMGRQERWILDNLERFDAASIMTVGACMEYVAENVKTPPRWMGRAGCEWLFRLLENPSRFWYRYIIEPWFVFGHLAWRSIRRPQSTVASAARYLHNEMSDAPTLERSKAATSIEILE
jgi:N-acetylglucosaminyldiphosphoundecaprenol N-acetyl-beta-D-mannosaminyltransferase